jgi:hypothetical protein
MGVAMTLTRRALRRHRTSWIWLTATVTCAAALSLGCFATARRTASAPARYLAATNAADVTFSSDPACGDHPCTVDDFAALDGVGRVARNVRVLGVLEAPDGSLVVDDDGSAMLAAAGGPVWTLDRPLLRAGRLPAPDSADEVFASEMFATAHRLEVGDVLALRTFGLDDIPAATAESQGGPRVGRTVRVKVVGIGPVASGLGPASIVLAPPPVGERMVTFGATFAIELDRGTAGADAFTREVQRRFDVEPDTPVATTHAAGQRTLRTYALALSAYGLLVVMLGALLVAQMVARQVRAEASDDRSLAALGVTGRQRRGAMACRVVVAGAAGVAVAAAGSTLSSWWSPVGPARDVEPNPGFDVDWTVVLAGALAWVILVVASGMAGDAIGRGRATPTHARRDVPAARSLPIPLAIAVRFVRPATSRDGSVPGRSAVGGLATFAMLATGCVTFAAGLQRLVDTPAFYGVAFDSSIFLGYQERDPVKLDAAAAAARALLVAEASVERVTPMAGGVLNIGAEGLESTGTDDDPDAFTLVSGRAPAASDEIVLGSRSASRLHVGLGDTVRAQSRTDPVAFTVVGKAVLSTTFDEGAWVTLDGLHRVFPHRPVTSLGVRFRPGTSEATAARALERAAAVLQERLPDPSVDRPLPPAEATRLLAVDGLPRALGLTLALAGLVTLTHTLLLALRARRRDMATLRAVGLRPGQVRITILLEAGILVAGGLLVGLPIGTAAGRWVWSQWAGDLGVIDRAVTPALFLVAVVPAALAAALLAAVGPARRASRQPVATILHAE